MPSIMINIKTNVEILAFQTILSSVETQKSQLTLIHLLNYILTK